MSGPAEAQRQQVLDFFSKYSKKLDQAEKLFANYVEYYRPTP